MKNFVKLSFTLALAVLTLSGCNCFKKMAKNLDDVTVTCTPEVLTLNNGKVAATVAVSFPAGYFDEDATVKITPVLVYEGGESAATPYYYQGEDVEDNYKVLSSTSTGATEDIEFAYTPEMRRSTLQLRVEVKCKDEFEVINLNTGKVLDDGETAQDAGYNIAEGINTLQSDLRPQDVMTMMESGYKRVTNSVEKSDLMYTISSSTVSSKALSAESVKAFQALVDENSNNDRATQKLSAQGYASPDGPVKFNDKLSKSRSESGKKAMEKLLKDYGLAIDASSYGEDWEGFKELVEASNIEDKNLILQVLSLYSSSTQREEEIKNMAAVFSTLKSEVLPQLRRTKMVNSVDLVGKSDEEMMALVSAKNYDALTLLEILHLCNKVVKDCETKTTLLAYVTDKYNDGVAYNNYGVVLAKQGKGEDALAAFKKAAELGVSDREVGNNLALAYMMLGDTESAAPYVRRATSQTKAMFAAMNGDYTAASTELKGLNKAIALVQLGQYDAAKSAIDCECAEGDYLRAVIASLQGDVKSAQTQLESAISKKACLKEKAATDVNLLNLFESGYTL
ncbi:MAG: hypothetical protein SNG10_07405 [Rikenellaceae bacterium]